MPKVYLDEIETATAQALVRHGARDEVARLVAHAVRTAEANGNNICGLSYVESYCRQLTTGRIDGTVEPAVTAERPGAIHVDGRLGFAQPAFAAGFDTAVEAARSNGVCGYAVAHTHTSTSLGYFTEQFTEAGLLAIGTANASRRLAPPGGSVPVLGANPIAMAVPDGRGGVAFQFDFSTSVVAVERIFLAEAAGESIPLGWAVDRDGEPTTDPAAALAGSLLWAGDHKGYGLGLLVELLASALTGSRRSARVPPLKSPYGPPHDLGQFYLVIDPSAFSGRLFYSHLEELAASIADQEGARLPGTGRVNPYFVKVDDDLWATVLDLA